MEVTFTTHDKWIVLHVSGRIDALTNELFESKSIELIDQAATGCLIDMSSLQYISSAGLRSVLMVVRHCQQNKYPIALCGMQKTVADVFKISGFSEFLNIAADIPGGLAMLK
ncbi:STAS domain-containing protein [Anaerobiospirillum sp. NML120449]|uniref:STAS domain-containing protein n=1 Tax=Anaerobiospirillum sp. NML120449 TaxID=2932817 RepID=UPI001FF16AB0|nr:STAS domain-containing protein [Anaerobiospirillum sp. NML120449]MCK0526967.1 STAS domain-containing protein [Anaerobiospirillum sp. NML120449]